MTAREMAERALARMYPATWPYTAGRERERLLDEAARVLDAAAAPALLEALDGVANSLEAEVRRADGSCLHLKTLVDYCRERIAQARGERGK